MSLTRINTTLFSTVSSTVKGAIGAYFYRTTIGDNDILESALIFALGKFLYNLIAINEDGKDKFDQNHLEHSFWKSIQRINPPAKKYIEELHAKYPVYTYNDLFRALYDYDKDTALVVVRDAAFNLTLFGLIKDVATASFGLSILYLLLNDNQLSSTLGQVVIESSIGFVIARATKLLTS